MDRSDIESVKKKQTNLDCKYKLNEFMVTETKNNIKDTISISKDIDKNLDIAKQLIKKKLNK